MGNKRFTCHLIILLSYASHSYLCTAIQATPQVENMTGIQNLDLGLGVCHSPYSGPTWSHLRAVRFVVQYLHTQFNKDVSTSGRPLLNLFTGFHFPFSLDAVCGKPISVIIEIFHGFLISCMRFLCFGPPSMMSVPDCRRGVIGQCSSLSSSDLAGVLIADIRCSQPSSITLYQRLILMWRLGDQNWYQAMAIIITRLVAQKHYLIEQWQIWTSRLVVVASTMLCFCPKRNPSKIANPGVPRMGE